MLSIGVSRHQLNRAVGDSERLGTLFYPLSEVVKCGRWVGSDTTEQVTV